MTLDDIAEMNTETLTLSAEQHSAFVTKCAHEYFSTCFDNLKRFDQYEIDISEHAARIENMLALTENHYSLIQQVCFIECFDIDYYDAEHNLCTRYVLCLSKTDDYYFDFFALKRENLCDTRYYHFEDHTVRDVMIQYLSHIFR